MTRNNEDAEDVVQESFQLAFIHSRTSKAIPGFRRGCPALHHAALMKLRKKHRLWDVSLDESAETQQLSPGLRRRPGPNPEQLYAQKERQRFCPRP